MKATEVTTGLAESNGSLLPYLWRDSLHVTCGLTARTPGSAPGLTLGNEYGKTLPYTNSGTDYEMQTKEDGGGHCVPRQRPVPGGPGQRLKLKVQRS